MANSIIKSVSLSREASMIVERMTENKNFNFSAWVTDRVIKDLGDKEHLIVERDKLRKKIEEIEGDIASIEKWENSRPKQDLSAEEKKYLKETAELLSHSPQYLDGRRSWYINTFHKGITKTEFIKLMGDVSDGKV